MGICFVAFLSVQVHQREPKQSFEKLLRHSGSCLIRSMFRAYGNFRDISEHMLGPSLLLVPSVSLPVLRQLDWYAWLYL